MNNDYSLVVYVVCARALRWVLVLAIVFGAAALPHQAQAASLFANQIPVSPNGTDGVPYEMGMKFQLARPGQITAVRYWKAASDGGTHIGRIWSSTGALLASVTFSGETASGWQQQGLATPLAIQASAVYTVSVNVASHFPVTLSGLSTAIVNGDITSVADGRNGVFGSPGAFPAASYQGSNYFRDIVFVPAAVGPAVKIGLTPASSNAQTGNAVAYTASIQDANGNPVITATGPISFTVSGVSGSFNPASPVSAVGGSATSNLTASTAGTAIVTASAAGLPSATATLIVSNPSTGSQSLFTTQTPASPSLTDGVPYEIGTKFRLARSGSITAIRYWKASADTGTHTGRIWSSSGSLLASVTFTGESASGWQQRALATPLAVQPNTTYTVSVNIGSRYPLTSGGLANQIVNGDISSIADGNNGVFGNPFAFPTNSWQNSNYFRDIVFVANSAPIATKLALTPITFSPQIGNVVAYTATIQDASGATVTTANNPVSFSVSGVSGLFSPASPVSAVSGVVTSSLTPTTVGNGIVTVTAAGLTSATATLNVAPGLATKLALVPSMTSTPAGTAVSYTATVQDANGNTVGTAGNVVTFSVSGVTGSFNPLSPVTPTGGIAVSSLIPSTVGNATVTASAAGLTSATATLNVTAGAAAKLVLVPSVTSTQVGTAVSYTATIEDVGGNRVSTANNAVTFSVGGISGSFSPASPVTSTAGTATSTLTATTVGTGTVTVTAAGLSSASATLTVAPGAPAKLMLVPTAISTQVGSAVTYTSTIQDAGGNIVTTASNSITYSVSGIAGSFTPASPITPAAGVATSSLMPTTPGSATVTASAAGLTSATVGLIVTTSVGPPVKLALLPASQSAQAGVAVTYTAIIQDANGNTVTTASDAIAFSVSGTAGSFNPVSPVVATGGLATSQLTPTTTGTATVTVSASGLTSASAALRVTPAAGPPAKLLLLPANASSQVGAALAYTATITDINDITVLSATGPVTFEVTGVIGSFDPTSPVTALAGVAMSSLVPTTEGTATITVSAEGLTSASATLDVAAAAGSPSKLALLPVTSSTLSGAAVLYTATIQDTNGHTISTASNPISFSVSGVSGTFSPVSPVSPAAGIATSSLTPTTVGNATITVAASGLTSASATLTVAAGEPVKLLLVPGNTNTTAGVAVNYTATIQDASGNTVSTADTPITFSVSGVSATFSPTSPVTPTAGVASSTLTATTMGNATITATAAGLTSASAMLTVAAGAPAKLTLAPGNANTQAGVAVSYTATIQDASGNTIGSANSAISFSVSGVAGTFGPSSSITPTAGIAVSSLTPTTVGNATITVTAAGLISATATLTVTAGAPARLALTPLNASTQAGVARTYTATIEDVNGNTASTATNPVSFSVSGVSGSFSPAAPLTPTAGIATSSLTATTVGNATVTVSATGLTSVTTSVTVTPGVPTKLVLTPATASTSIGVARSYTVTIQDAGGNTVTSATNPVAFSISGASGSFNPVSPMSPVGGTATSSFTPTTAGTANITASATGLTSATASLTVSGSSSGSSQSLFTTQTPVVPNDTDGVPYELGMRFQLARAGKITAIRYWKSANDSGTHVGRLWSATGSLLTSATFTGETASGWQQQTLPTPLSVQANTIHVVSVNVASHYAFTDSGLATSIVNGDISSVSGGNNGVYGNPFVFPTNSYRNSNYFRDIVFSADLVSSIAKVSGDNQSGTAGAVLPNPLVVIVRDANNSPLANVPITFAASTGGSVSPASATTNASGQASTTLKLASSGATTAAATASGIGSVTFTGMVSNAIFLENQNAGTTAWAMTNPVTTTAPEIAGYAGATSVNKGSSLPMKISLAQAGQYTIDVYRLGYYAGAGGRLMGSFGPLAGVKQQNCNVTVRATLLIECKWNTSFTLAIGANWTSGLYVANLRAVTNARQSQIWFVVRDDSSHSDLLFQSSFNTFLAYNNYGDAERHSLYEYNSTNGQRASKVSFDRPLGAVTGDPTNANNMLRYERNMARWLESQSYDVTYISNVDTHINPAQLSQHKAFLSVGHDEYWSLEMRNGVEQARDAGVNLGFFSANTAYWRVRFEPSTNGDPNRVMVCYKDPGANDPVAPTYLWRGPENNRPENALLGVMYIGDYNGDGFNYVVNNAGNSYYNNTGLANNTAVTGLVGYEWDAVVNNGFTPSGLVVLASSPVVPTTAAPGLPPGTDLNISHAVRYTAASGAKVFSTGSVQFAWGLDSSNAPSVADNRIRQFVINIFADMGAKPLTPSPGMIVP